MYFGMPLIDIYVTYVQQHVSALSIVVVMSICKQGTIPCLSMIKFGTLVRVILLRNSLYLINKMLYSYFYLLCKLNVVNTMFDNG